MTARKRPTTPAQHVQRVTDVEGRLRVLEVMLADLARRVALLEKEPTP